IRDDKLKKNEVRVTVIATGFPESETSYHMPPQMRAAEQEPQSEGEKEPARGRIFNVMSQPRAQEEEPAVAARQEEPAVASATPKEPKPIDSIDEETDDDWGAVPAFLRRSKLK